MDSTDELTDISMLVCLQIQARNPGKVDSNLTSGLVTYCGVPKTAWWRPACCWLGWGSMSIETPLKAIRVEVGLVKNYHEQDRVRKQSKLTWLSKNVEKWGINIFPHTLIWYRGDFLCVCASVFWKIINNFWMDAPIWANFFRNKVDLSRLT